MKDLSHILATPIYQLQKGLWLDLDLFLKADRQHGSLDLFYPRPTEPQVKAMIAEASDLLVVPVITDADDWNFADLDQIN